MEAEVVSTSFTSSSGDSSSVDISEQFLHLVDELNESLEQLKIPDDVVVYNPTIYAREPFEMYVRKYCNTPKRILFLGMNPEPFGMCQTGIPFGDIKSVRNWLGITGSVGKPPREIKDREVLGFDCTRPEVSGQRFWGLFRTLCGTPENFFKTSFVYNYWPQRCMNAKGVRSCIPAELKMPELYNICDPILHKVLKLYQVEIIVAIGIFCETRAKETIRKYSLPKPVNILYLTHPSLQVRNIKNWTEHAINFLKENNLLQYYTQPSA